ncbi:GNAT family N-acetyltransferase [Paenibacillus sp. JX-17]|uniref:GNAT family N-acetyltransferase n=1 Tax=Paenibacillus lacisoli TaxID=3064525 RepID=A0ABT9CB78_9BACL|nr:GNAT family N-acetyltransferase [Paenibacillus sp. JX-17]MDO7906130.1 GNAT family N-acetyltransferase [Paenibacillus sp. JX-17]
MVQMIKINRASAGSWPLRRRQLLAFTRLCGGRRITREELCRLAGLTLEDLEQPGSSLLYACVRTERGTQTAGLCLTLGYGEDTCLVVVRPLYRDAGLGTRLVTAQLQQLGKLSCRVPYDHIPCLKICLHAGLTATRIIQTPGGKASLVFQGTSTALNGSDAGDDRDKEDWLCLNLS